MHIILLLIFIRIDTNSVCSYSVSNVNDIRMGPRQYRIAWLITNRHAWPKTS